MDLDRCHKDKLDETAHLFCAMVLCFFTPWMTTATELAGAPLMVWFVLGLWRHARAARWVLALPQFVLLAAFCTWQWITLLWSPDVQEGIKQAGATRWLWYIPALFPILRYRRALIVALMLGFLAGNASQLAHVAGVRLGVPELTWKRMPHRDSGWWDPVVAGTLLTAALGLYLPSAFSNFGKRAGLLGIAGTLVTLLGILATGTRGAWLAAAALLAIAAPICLWRAATTPRQHAGGERQALHRAGLHRAMLRRGAPVLLLALAGLITLLAFGPTLRARFTLAQQDIRRAIDAKDFTSDTGARLLLNWWGLQSLSEHPVRGVGMGGFRAWSVEHMRQAGIDPQTRSTHAHAHNALLHVGATTGAVGLALALGAVLLSLRGAWRAGPAGMDGGVFPSPSGPFFAMLGLLLVSAFDTVHVNAQTSALGFLLIALSPSWMPVPAKADQTTSGTRV